MDKIDHLMAEKNENNKDSQKGQVTGILSYQNSILHQGRIIKIAYSNKCKSLLLKNVLLYAQF
jgi:hypothetical protein